MCLLALAAVLWLAPPGLAAQPAAAKYPKVDCHVETPCEADCDAEYSNQFTDGVSHWIVCVEACGVNWDLLTKVEGTVPPLEAVEAVQSGCHAYCDRKYGKGIDFTKVCYYGCARWADRCTATIKK